MTTAAPTAPAVPRTAASYDAGIAGAAIVLLLVALLVLVGLPLWALLSKSLYSDGVYVGLQNFIAYVTTPSLFRSSATRPPCRTCCMKSAIAAMFSIVRTRAR